MFIIGITKKNSHVSDEKDGTLMTPSVAIALTDATLMLTPMPGNMNGRGI